MLTTLHLIDSLNSRPDLRRIDASGSSTGDHHGGCLSSLVMRNTMVSPTTWANYPSPVPEVNCQSVHAMFDAVPDPFALL